jgi:oxygen-dependent protoporphyrinogen oxidase
MLAAAAPTIAAELAAVEYASSATVNLAYRRSEVSDPLAAFGFVVPAVERLPIIACTYSSQKYAGRARDGIVLLRAFAGGALFPEQLARDDAALIDSAHDCLAKLLGIGGKPLDSLVSRYPSSMPQYHVGHLARLDRIDRALDAFPTLALAGNAYRGTGIPDCIASGEAAAERLTLVETRPA